MPVQSRRELHVPLQLFSVASKMSVASLPATAHSPFPNLAYSSTVRDSVHADQNRFGDTVKEHVRTPVHVLASGPYAESAGHSPRVTLWQRSVPANTP